MLMRVAVIFFLFVLFPAIVLAETHCGDIKRAVIFDIDDTLVDTNYRTLAILQQIGIEQSIPPLETLEIGNVDFFCSVTLKNTGVGDPGLTEKICGHFDPDPTKNTMNSSLWGKAFFSDSRMIRFDHVIAGAPQFVESISEKARAKVIYLSGRNQETLKQGTIEELTHYGFPGFRRNTSDCAQLILKPKSFSGDDTAFKTIVAKDLIDRLGYTIVAAFDDQAPNANAFRALLPVSAPVIRPNRNVLDDAKNAPAIDQISSYYYNVQIDPSTKQRSVTPNQDELQDVKERAASVR